MYLAGEEAREEQAFIEKAVCPGLLFTGQFGASCKLCLLSYRYSNGSEKCWSDMWLGHVKSFNLDSE